MKKVFLRREASLLANNFSIYDENEELLYLSNNKPTLKRKLHITDVSENELASLERFSGGLNPTYKIVVNDQFVTTIKKAAFFKREYDVKEIGWKVTGDFWGFNYQIEDDERLVARIAKSHKWFDDSYEIETYDEENILTVLMVILNIDMDVRDEEAASVTTTVVNS